MSEHTNIQAIVYCLVNIRQSNRTVTQFCEELESLVTEFTVHYNFTDSELFLYNQFKIGIDQYYKEAIDELFIEKYIDCKNYCIQLEQNLLENHIQL